MHAAMFQAFLQCNCRSKRQLQKQVAFKSLLVPGRIKQHCVLSFLRNLPKKAEDYKVLTKYALFVNEDLYQMEGLCFLFSTRAK